MKPYSHPRSSSAAAGQQKGVALIISLILLVVITLMSLAGMQGTTLQERMSSNMYDRSLAMQAAEAALRAAEFAISANADLGIDCTPDSGNLCSPYPANTFNGNSGDWATVVAPYLVNAGNAAGAAQYHIQIVGDGSIEDDYGQTNSANTRQYGTSGGAPVARHYQVTARSHNPASAGGTSRAIVVLQTSVVRAL